MSTPCLQSDYTYGVFSGRHYFYNMSQSLDCADFESFAPIYDEVTGELVSTAYFMIGRTSQEHSGRHWFEEPNGVGIKVRMISNTYYISCIYSEIGYYRIYYLKIMFFRKLFQTLQNA